MKQTYIAEGDIERKKDQTERTGFSGAIQFTNRVKKDVIEEVFRWYAEVQTPFEPAKNGSNHDQGNGNRDAVRGKVSPWRQWPVRISCSHAPRIVRSLIRAETPEKS